MSLRLAASGAPPSRKQSRSDFSHQMIHLTSLSSDIPSSQPKIQTFVKAIHGVVSHRIGGQVYAPASPAFGLQDEGRNQTSTEPVPSCIACHAKRVQSCAVRFRGLLLRIGEGSNQARQDLRSPQYRWNARPGECPPLFAKQSSVEACWDHRSNTKAYNLACFICADESDGVGTDGNMIIVEFEKVSSQKAQEESWESLQVQVRDTRYILAGHLAQLYRRRPHFFCIGWRHIDV